MNARVVRDFSPPERDERRCTFLSRGLTANVMPPANGSSSFSSTRFPLPLVSRAKISRKLVSIALNAAVNASNFICSNCSIRSIRLVRSRREGLLALRPLAHLPLHLLVLFDREHVHGADLPQCTVRFRNLAFDLREREGRVHLTDLLPEHLDFDAEGLGTLIDCPELDGDPLLVGIELHELQFRVLDMLRGFAPFRAEFVEYPGELLLPLFKGSNLGLVGGDLLVGSCDIGIDLAVALVLPGALFAQFDQPGIEVLAFALGIVDVRFLVAEPAF